MVDLWWEEAARNDVLPLDNRPLFAILNPRPTTRQVRDTYVYYPDGAPVPESVAVNVRNRSHTITAFVTVPDGVVPSGTLLALGSVLGGFTLQLVDGRLRYVHNLYGASRDVVESAMPCSHPGRTRSRSCSPRPPSTPGGASCASTGRPWARATSRTSRR